MLSRKAHHCRMLCSLGSQSLTYAARGRLDQKNFVVLKRLGTQGSLPVALLPKCAPSVLASEHQEQAFLGLQSLQSLQSRFSLFAADSAWTQMQRNPLESSRYSATGMRPSSACRVSCREGLNLVVIKCMALRNQWIAILLLYTSRIPETLPA